MYRLLSCLSFILLFIAVGCTNSLDYHDDDIAAVVRGEEITIGELRFLYPDEKVLHYIGGTVKARLAMQEAKRLNIDVTKQVQETLESYGSYPSESVDTPMANSIRGFAEPQARKLGLEPEEYYAEYVVITTEMSAYTVAYVEKMLGKLKITTEEHHERIDQMQDYDEQANELLNNLVEENKDEIQILIKSRGDGIE